MATTGSVAYLRLRTDNSVSSNRITGSISYIALRAVSGLFSTGVMQGDRRNLKSLFPPQRVPISFVDNDKSKPLYMEPAAWYKYFEFNLNTLQGGIDAVTMLELRDALLTAQLQSIALAAGQVAIQQQAVANAQALAAAIEVVQTAELEGATQIPKVQLEPAPISTPVDGSGGGGSE